MKKILEDIYTRLIKNPITTLIGVCLIVGLVMVYKGKMTIEQLMELSVAIGAFVALLYKANSGSNNTPTPPSTT